MPDIFIYANCPNFQEKKKEYNKSMELFDSRYFIINNTCMKLLGIWPYSSHVKNYLRRCGLGLFLLSCYLPQFIPLYMYFGEDMDQMIQNIGVILYVFGTSVKLITGVTAKDRMKIVYEKTARDFQTIVDKEERNILFEYSERGRTLSITFIIYMWIALAIYVGLPMGPLVLDYFIPLQNGSRERGFVWKGEYLVDPDKYYLTIYAVELFSSVLSVTILSSVGPMYQAIVEHCLGLFVIVKFRLQICTRGGKKAEEESYRLIVKIIRLHNDIIEFTRIIEASYTSYFFIEMDITISLVTLISVNASIFDTAPDRLLEIMLLIFVQNFH
ncbi:odorant receptor 135 isoform X1 [Nasonia vitripennis]|uniref:Odorant receptor n=1 Tax=Nasonia vitripennis TaxID=7425 RepID=A0A7M7TBM7_NASVI|nr:odorant receptor 135 isoform X1 [Nasonia vitripennis]